jgi:hypothetical protein
VIGFAHCQLYGGLGLGYDGLGLGYGGYGLGYGYGGYGYPYGGYGRYVDGRIQGYSAGLGYEYGYGWKK